MKKAVTEIPMIPAFTLQPKITPFAAYEKAMKGATHVSWRDYKSIVNQVSELPDHHALVMDFCADIQSMTDNDRYHGIHPMANFRHRFLNRVEELKEVLGLNK